MPAPVSSQQNGNISAIPTTIASDGAQSQWLFTPAELLKSPSILEGLPVAQELANRQKGVNFITQVGIMLKLPQLTLATASVFLHRFYMRYPMQVSKDKGIHHYQAAATALFLATKVEENCRKMKELIVACCRVAQKDPNSFVDEQSKEYWKWRDTILYHEDLLLEALCFDLQLEQPYRILFDFICYYGVQEQKNLRNTAWAFLNDSHVTTLCLLYSERTIAGSALYAGVKLAHVTLPDDEHGRPWWQHLDLDIFEIQKACNQMAEVYENPTVPRKGQKDAYSKEDDIMSFDRTRRTQSPSIEHSPSHSIRSASQGVKRDREDSWGHEAKNGHMEESGNSLRSANGQTVPSPKRQRTSPDSMNTGAVQQRAPLTATSVTVSRVPAGAGSRVPAVITPQNDTVQQTIDDIVNGASSRREHALQLRNTSDNQHAALDRSNGTRVSGGDQAGSTTRARASNVNDRPIRHDAQQNNQQNSYSRTIDVRDNTEEVDYGSEEGEV